MTDVVIAAAARTAIGSFNGSLSGFHPAELGEAVIREALARAQVDPAEVDEVLLGQVLTAGQGMNPARQAAMKAGIPVSATAVTLNQVCGSGLRAVAWGAQQVLLGDARIIVAGGQESMTNAFHVGYLRSGVRMGSCTLADSMILDGLTDVFNNCHMGVTAENIASRFGITREEQDAFAAASQQKAEAAMKGGRFKPEICPLTYRVKKEEKIFDTDEFPRAGVTVEGLAKLRPAFSKEGTVTAGNASGINDGAAAVVLMTARQAEAQGITPLARIVSWATAGVDPAIMGIGPIPATRKALAKAGWTVADLDLIEANEAFAVQAIAVDRDLGWDPARVNVNGGAIALGHPIGASGARLLVTLLYEMGRRNAKKGLATLCIGGGMGIAMCVER